MSFSPIRRLGSLATVFGLTLLATQAQAANFTWTAAANNNWSAGFNAAPASDPTTTLTFIDGASYTATDDLAANPFILNGMTFNNTGTNVVTIAGANPLNFQANGATQPTITRSAANAGNVVIGQNIQLGVAGTVANLTISGAAGTITLNGGITDNSGLATGSNVAKTGAGTLTFAGTNGTTTSTFNQLSVQGGTVNVTGGTMNLLQPDPGTRIPGLQIGSASGQVGTFVASGGATINVQENVFIGHIAGSTGTLTVTGVGTTLSNENTNQFSGRFAVGESGNGTLNILNGAVVNAGFMLTNRSNGTSATINVDGVGSTLNTIVTINPTTLLANGGTGNLQIASNGAAGTPNTGTLNVTNGGHVNVGTTLFVGQTAGNTGIINLSGVGSQINVPGGNIQLGSAVNGHGSMTVSGGATSSISGTFFVGNASGTAGIPGDGTLTVTGAGSTISTTTGGIQAGTTAGSVGTVNILNGGTANITGSIFVGPAGAGATGFPDANGTLNVMGGGVLNGSAFLIVSGGGTPGGTGTLNVSNNGLVNVVNFTVTQNDGGTGTATVSNGGKLLVSSQFEVGGGASGGAGGSATMNINSGGQVVVGGLSFESATTVNGTITLNGYQSSLTSTGQVQLGGNGGTASTGTAVLTANAGSNVTLGDTILYANGSMNVNTAANGSFTVADIRGNAAGNGSVIIGTNSTLTINGSTGAFIFDGAISGAGNLTKTGASSQAILGANSYGGTTNANGGVLGFGNASNLGTGAITFNGGTLQWTNNGSFNTTDITAGGRAVTLNAGGGTLDTNFNSFTLGGVINGQGGLTIVGGGTVTLGGTNTYNGPTTISSGNLVIGADAALGSATSGFNGVPNTVSGTPAGTLIVGGTGGITTSRLFNMNGGTIAVSPASPNTQTLTFNGSLVQGATLDASPGGSYATGANGAGFNHVNTTASVTLASNSGNDQFFNFTNGGALNVAANIPTATPVTMRNFTNQGSGSVTVGASTLVNAANYQTYGVTTLSPGTTALPTQLTNNGSSQLFFNGGSRTFISVAGQQAQFNAGIDLHGNNATVSGGLFVNNGYVVDTVGTGTKTIIADYNALVKGAGFYQNSVITQNGGKFQSGNSPGLSQVGNLILGPGGTGNFLWQITDPGPSATFPSAPGIYGGTSSTPGQLDFGWSGIKAVKVGPSPGNLTWTATAAAPLVITMQTLTGATTVGNDILGQMQNFDPNLNYTWQMFNFAGTYTGPNIAGLEASTTFDVVNGPFANPRASGSSFHWSLVDNSPNGGHLDMLYVTSAVPEPGSMALLGAAGAGIGWVIRRRKAAKK
jgi:T5SS/PEP-CTERM-associated repeat protein